MSNDKRQDRAAIERAAQNAANTAVPHFQAAVDYAKKYTQLDGNAFGIVPSIALKPPYEDARTSQLKNLEDGLEKLKAMINGLATVAHNMYSAEARNTITPNRDALNIEVKPPKVDGGNNLGVIPIAFGFGYGLPGWLACQVIKTSFMPLCAAATISSIMWLSVMPNDEEIDKAISAWTSVGTELNAIGQLSQVLSLSEDAWDDDARTAFNTWVNNFQTELNSAKAMAAGEEPGEGGNAKALKDCLDAIVELQNIMLGVDIACLVALIAAFIMKAFPPTSGAGAMLEWVTAISNAVATGAVVGAIVVLTTTYALEMHKISKKGEFATLKISNDPNKRYGEDSANDTFIDLDLDWLPSSA